MTEYILDVRGLTAWADLSGNEYGAIAAALRDGRILLYSRVWQEFSVMYPDEAAGIADDALPRQRISQADRIAASALADHVEATFGQYDDGSDWVVAARAVGEDLIVVTTEPARSSFYATLNGCNAISVDELLNQL